jgi:hypothetical protein
MLASIAFSLVFLINLYPHLHEETRVADLPADIVSLNYSYEAVGSVVLCDNITSCFEDMCNLYILPDVSWVLVSFRAADQCYITTEAHPAAGIIWLISFVTLACCITLVISSRLHFQNHIQEMKDRAILGTLLLLFKLVATIPYMLIMKEVPSYVKVHFYFLCVESVFSAVEYSKCRSQQPINYSILYCHDYQMVRFCTYFSSYLSQLSTTHSTLQQ